MVSFLVPTFYLLIFGVPVAAVTASFLLADTTAQKILCAFFAPVVFTTLYILTAGLLSRIGMKAVIPGIFPRDVKHPVYGFRRLYASAWTSIYYFTPLYFVALSVPILKKITLRLFGYSFSTNFTAYPDTWLRDLTCVKFEDGAYLANKCTIGTNICLSDGRILVDRIKVGEKSIVGHGSMLAPGAKLENECELGAGSQMGIRARLKNGARTGAGVGISHGSVIGEKCQLENHAYLGTKCVLGDSITVPAAASIPAGATFSTQEELNEHLKNEEQILNQERSKYFRNSRSRTTSEKSLTDISVIRKRDANAGKQAG